jgi:hypothetical protein
MSASHRSSRTVLACAVAIAVALGVTGCGSDTAEEAQPAASTAVPSASATSTESVEWTGAEEGALIDTMYEQARQSFDDGGGYWLVGAEAVLEDAATLVPSVIKTYPAGATWTMNLYRANYGANGGRNYLGCAASPTELVINLIVPQDKRSMAIAISDDTTTGFSIVNTDRKGKSGYDKDGFAQGSGPCQPASQANPGTPVKTKSGSFDS